MSAIELPTVLTGFSVDAARRCRRHDSMHGVALVDGRFQSGLKHFWRKISHAITRRVDISDIAGQDVVPGLGKVDHLLQHRNGRALKQTRQHGHGLTALAGLPSLLSLYATRMPVAPRAPACSAACGWLPASLNAHFLVCLTTLSCRAQLRRSYSIGEPISKRRSAQLLPVLAADFCRSPLAQSRRRHSSGFDPLLRSTGLGQRLGSRCIAVAFQFSRQRSQSDPQRLGRFRPVSGEAIQASLRSSCVPCLPAAGPSTRSSRRWCCGFLRLGSTRAATRRRRSPVRRPARWPE